MIHIPSEKVVLDRLITWGTNHPLIRAMILTSSRTRPDGPVDILSDYDLILAVSDVKSFAFENAWIFEYDKPMTRWGDQSEMHGLTTYFRSAVYQNHVKIDYSIWPVELLDRIAASDSLPDQLDVGYRVLLDKEQRTAGWKPPSYQAHIPGKPTESEYEALIEEFWWSATYVAKSLWRDDLVFARWVLDQDLKMETVRRMLEWRIEIDHNWSVKPGVLGRGLKQLLPPDIWLELATTYGSLDVEEIWTSFRRVITLFRRVATGVSDALGYNEVFQTKSVRVCHSERSEESLVVGSRFFATAQNDRDKGEILRFAQNDRTRVFHITGFVRQTSLYPQEVDNQVSDYLRGIREMPPS